MKVRRHRSFFAVALAASMCMPLAAQNEAPQEAQEQQGLDEERLLQDQELSTLAEELQRQRRQLDLEQQRLIQENRARSLAAQAGTRLPGALENRVFQLQHVRPSSLERVLVLFPGDISSVDQLNVLSVRAAADIMPAIEDVIRRLDVPAARSPQQTVELTVHILKASDDSDPEPLPASLRAVADQLESVLSYTSYELVDTMLMRGSAASSGDITATGTMALAESVGLAEDRPSFYNFSVRPRIAASDSGEPRVQLNLLRFGFRLPVISGGAATAANAGQATSPSVQYIDNGINTELEIAPNQQVVVGKTTVGPDALILVLSARILD
jgi:hypothetical protein